MEVIIPYMEIILASYNEGKIGQDYMVRFKMAFLKIKNRTVNKFRENKNVQVKKLNQLNDFSKLKFFDFP